jgi:hypothetical protein
MRIPASYSTPEVRRGGVAEPFLGDAGGENAPERISGFSVEFFLRAWKTLTEAVCKQFLHGNRDPMGTHILPAMMISSFANCSLVGVSMPLSLASRVRNSS